MDIRLSISVSPPPPVLHSLSPNPSLASAPVTSTAMPLPPEAIYALKEELYTSIQAWAAQYHFAFCVERSKKINNSMRTRILYSCDRAGPAPPTKHTRNSLQDRKRRTNTRKTGCQFSIIALERTDTQWELRHRPGIKYSQHNHLPSKSNSSHPAHRKLKQVEINQARSLHHAGRLIYHALKRSKLI